MLATLRSFCAALSMVPLAAASARAVVISEIHYNPPAGQDALEFVELTNDSSTPADISGYAFVNGISYVLPAGTVLDGGASIVVCADAAAVRAQYGITNCVGDYTGRLDASGERLTLTTQVGVVVQSLRYSDGGKWPSAADGTGHTLALRNVHLDSGEPESWAPSTQLGGSPGRSNFAGGGQAAVDDILIDRGASWRYAKGNAPFSTPDAAWLGAGFNDTAWLQGPSGFGYGDGDDVTVLADMQSAYLTVAARRAISLDAADLARAGDYYLGIDYDDGFCAWVNGTLVAQVNCGDPGVGLVWSQAATGSREAGIEDLFPVPRGLLRVGENILAISGHNFTVGSSDFSLIPRFFVRSVPQSISVCFNELVRSPSGQGWVELYNGSPHASADLAGLRLTDNPDRLDPFVIPAGTTVGPRGFLVLTEAQTGLDFSAAKAQVFLLDPTGVALAAATFERGPPPGAALGAYAEARFPDSGAIDWVTVTPTAGAANRVAAETDLVLNEVLYHSPQNRPGDFIELFNRGAGAIDASGMRFDKGIDFTMPPGTVVPAGGYLVLAADPAFIAAHHGLSGVLGPYAGSLADGGEKIRLVDRAGNPVDELRYADGGRWSNWADGGGSSLELIDPYQDNSRAPAWDASDETDKAPWEELRFSVPDYVPAGESELHLYWIARGIALIDDVVLRRPGGANLIPNPGFESTTAPWRIEGTHVGSRRVTNDAHTGVACLELSATGKGDALVNRIETDTTTAMARAAYDVSFWARWQRGASLLIAHGEFSAGAYCCRPGPAVNLSGNTLAARLRLSVPFDLGSPGAENSVRRRLRELSGSDNLGPLVDAVAHNPPAPVSGQAVRVLADVSDSDGVASVVLYHRQGSAAGAFANVLLADDGLHGDGDAEDGVFGGDLPGLTAGTKVVFYIEAVDALGASQRFPLDAPQSTCLYQVQSPLGGGIDTYQIVLDDQRTAELQNRPLHSNDLLSGTFVFNSESSYYEIGVRYRGSPWGRPGINNFRVRFPDDDRFHRGRRSINLSARAPSGREAVGFYLLDRTGTVEKPVPAQDYLFTRTFINGGSYGLQAMVQPVDGDFVETWYGPEARGPLLKAVGRLLFSDAGGLVNWDGASFVHMEEVSENYRGYQLPSVHRDEDEWEPFYALSRVMDTRTTPSARFDAEIDSVLDVEAFLRVYAPRVLMADWDAFSLGNGHNGYLVVDPSDGRWEMVAFDMDNGFGNATPPLLSSADANVARMLSRPWPLRTYYRVLWGMVNGQWSSSRSGAFFSALGLATGINMSGFSTYVDTGNAYVRGQIQSATSARFRIVTNGGIDISTDRATITLEGEAPVQAAAILWQRNADDAVPLVGQWTTAVRWRAELPLPERDNDFLFLGFDENGGVVGSTRIRVTNTTFGGAPQVSAWFPAGGPASGGSDVSFAGMNLAEGSRVFFGSAESPEVRFVSAQEVHAVSPRAPLPLSPSGLVDIRLEFPAGQSVFLRAAFTYVSDGGFVRGDVNLDGATDISDAVGVLLHLFAGSDFGCRDAADVNDDGAVDIADAVATLDFLFRRGAAPRPPFPVPGPDPTPDGLTCD